VDDRRPSPRKNEGDGDRELACESPFTLSIELLELLFKAALEVFGVETIKGLATADVLRFRRNRVGDGELELVSSPSMMATVRLSTFFSFHSFLRKVSEPLPVSANTLLLCNRLPPVTLAFAMYITSLGILAVDHQKYFNIYI